MIFKEMTFNTGRGYSAEGQVIRAAVIKCEIDDCGFEWLTVAFEDKTRGINGIIRDLLYFGEADIMLAYDNVRYTSTHKSIEELAK